MSSIHPEQSLLYTRCLEWKPLWADAARLEHIKEIDDRAAELQVVAEETPALCGLQRTATGRCAYRTEKDSVYEYTQEQSGFIDRHVVIREAARRGLRVAVNQELAAVVDQAAERSRYLWARASGKYPMNAVRIAGDCVPMSLILREVLRREHDINTVLMHRGPQVGHAGHAYLQTTGPESVVIDPTWQQFLRGNPQYDKLPLTMIAAVDDLAGAMESHDLSTDQLPIWQQGYPQQLDRRSLWPYSLNKIFDEQGWATG